MVIILVPSAGFKKQKYINMKAIEQRLAFAGVNYDADRHLKLHRERIRSTKKCIDNSLPLSYEKRNKSPTRKVMEKRGK